MQIIDLTPGLVRETARVMHDGFSYSGRWSTLTIETARREVEESLSKGRLSRVAYDDGVVGWIGGQPAYHGLVFELHPLVVRTDRQRTGIGELLVRDLELQVAELGINTVMLGTDDESNETSLGGIDLYPDPLAHLMAIRNRGAHPFSFYRKLGYAIVGCVPDANGFGKPDIIMAKRLTSQQGHQHGEGL